MAIGKIADIKGDWPTRNKAHIAHGALISITIIIWFPLGVFLLRTLKHPNTVRFHALWQTFGLFLLIVGFGLGAWLSSLQGGLYSHSHLILGIVIVVLFLLQPVLGWLHHRRFAATGMKGWMQKAHVWLGRVLLVLGVINGGTGLDLADNTKGGRVVYGVVAGVFGVAYLGVLWLGKRGEKKGSGEVELRDVPDANSTSKP